ncbi:MAG TPA: DUF998 domain-containing protein [Thermoplasmata archaeon]|nr:DUF998 domain-containing protein [Thermoplasmata archaeon]
MAAANPRITTRVGGALVAIGVVQFSVAMAVVQAAYPGYSDLQNYISDLGNTATSPWHPVFNVSIMILGALAFVGILLAWDGFPGGGTRAPALGLLLVASVAAILVGVFPENVNPTVHGLASLLVFAPGGIALVILGIGAGSSPRWRWLREISIGLGLVTLVALAYYVPTQSNNTTWDPGFVERLIVFPILVWGFLAAVELLRAPPPTPAPHAVPA